MAGKVIISCAITDSPCWPPVAARCRLRRRQRRWGGHVRVGLEDNLWLDKGKLAPSNGAQVTRVRHIIEGLGLEAATPCGSPGHA